MYFHVLIGISVLTSCLGESSNHAISSISFHRDDVPLSYKYNYIHIYSTEKPKSHTRPEMYKNVQYAPLVSNHNDKEKDDGLYTKAFASKWNKKENVTKKNEYLEPQVHSSGNHYGNRQFVAGYNIDAPKPYTVHNNINSDYKTIALHNNNKQSINKLILNTNTESLPPRNHESSQLNNFLVLNARHQENPSKSIQVLSVMEKANIHPVFNPYVKMPQLHLNVARAYNFAPMAIKAPSNGYQKLQRNNHDQSHVKLPDTAMLQKTFLYPLNNRQQNY